MIASLVCSVYIIYLYRKLNAAPEPQAKTEEKTGDGAAAAVRAEIATLNAKIDALETLLSSDRTAVTTP
jgi:hypothetical protein